MVAVMHHYVGAAEIQEMFGGISRQRIQQIIGRRDFPKPVVKLKMGKVWRRSDVEKWMRAHGRLTDDGD